MGTLRFCLATMVLLSHLGISFYGLNLGVTSVIMFYLLSGHVVTKLWSRWSIHPNGVFLFYADRALRIFPQYIFALFLSTILWLRGVDSGFLSVTPNFFDWVSNIIVIPLNYFMFTGGDNFILLPPSWSLAAELQFYLLAPLALSKNSSYFKTWLLVSFFIFLVAQFKLINLEIFGYRLLPGVLFIFMIGGFINGEMSKRTQTWMAMLWLTFVIYFFILLKCQNHQPFNQEVVLGLLVGIPLIVSIYNIKNRFEIEKEKSLIFRIDCTMGFLSYGIFLYHFPAIWFLRLTPPVSLIKSTYEVFAISLVMALMGHFLIEKPLWKRLRINVKN
jgi:peptidoglycan/LPS O-acetylase OafA/YrhL